MHLLNRKRPSVVHRCPSAREDPVAEGYIDVLQAASLRSRTFSHLSIFLFFKIVLILVFLIIFLCFNKLFLRHHDR